MISLQNLILIAALLYFSAFSPAKAAETNSLECSIQPSVFLKGKSANALINILKSIPNTESFQSRTFEIDDSYEGTLQVFFRAKRSSEKEWLLETYSNSMEAPTEFMVREIQTIHCK